MGLSHQYFLNLSFWHLFPWLCMAGSNSMHSWSHPHLWPTTRLMPWSWDMTQYTPRLHSLLLSVQSNQSSLWAYHVEASRHVEALLPSWRSSDTTEPLCSYQDKGHSTNPASSSLQAELYAAAPWKQTCFYYRCPDKKVLWYRRNILLVHQSNPSLSSAFSESTINFHTSSCKLCLCSQYHYPYHQAFSKNLMAFGFTRKNKDNSQILFHNCKTGKISVFSKLSCSTLGTGEYLLKD